METRPSSVDIAAANGCEIFYSQSHKMWQKAKFKAEAGIAEMMS